MATMFDVKEGEEKFSMIHTGTDKLARRVLNTAPKTIPNIPLDRIGLGVSIEQLESMNVPVYKYQTQVTIHGQFPDNLPAYVRGYKSLVVNGNGTLGVRYVAIDAEKKKTIENALGIAGGKWHTKHDTRNMTVRRFGSFSL